MFHLGYEKKKGCQILRTLNSSVVVVMYAKWNWRRKTPGGKFPSQNGNLNTKICVFSIWEVFLFFHLQKKKKSKTGKCEMREKDDKEQWMTK